MNVALELCLLTVFDKKEYVHPAKTRLSLIKVITVRRCIRSLDVHTAHSINSDKKMRAHRLIRFYMWLSLLLCVSFNASECLEKWLLT